MPDLTVEFDVECAECGKTLEVEVKTDRYGGTTTHTVKVTPCDTCLEKAHEAGREDAENEAADG